MMKPSEGKETTSGRKPRPADLRALGHCGPARSHRSRDRIRLPSAAAVAKRGSGHGHCLPARN